MLPFDEEALPSLLPLPMVAAAAVGDTAPLLEETTSLRLALYLLLAPELPEPIAAAAPGLVQFSPAMPYSAKRCISSVRMCTSSGNSSVVVFNGSTVVCRLCMQHNDSIFACHVLSCHTHNQVFFANYMVCYRPARVMLHHH